MNRKLLIVSLLGLLTLSCAELAPDTKNDDQEQGPAEDIVQVEDKDGYTVKGYVSCDGQAVSGAVVSDGIHVTRTNRQGKYWM